MPALRRVMRGERMGLLTCTRAVALTCIGVALAGCASRPPPPPPRSPASAHRPVRRPAPPNERGVDHARTAPAAPATPDRTAAACAPAGRGQLSEADKADLFRRFSDWESRGASGGTSLADAGPACRP